MTCLWWKWETIADADRSFPTSTKPDHRKATDRGNFRWPKFIDLDPWAKHPSSEMAGQPSHSQKAALRSSHRFHPRGGGKVEAIRAIDPHSLYPPTPTYLSEPY
ncbi:hypothetical protein [[Phormidium] sp. ETS-05]|uniref:hypothetical protein n=1 Tax=[Phormidium] sp. ETS-05 TaxID=222819 RepID=UPI0018EEF34B|nr:hypothetical protein [[Phormidium] sp. ETS-05]